MKSDVPKVLHEVCGKPIVRYVLDIVQSFGSLKIYVVLGHKSQDVKQYLGKGYCCVEQKRLLGTADAVRCTEKYLKGYQGDILILCGDTPLLNKDVIKNIVKKHQASKAAGTLLTAEVNDPEGYGRIIRDDQGKVCEIVERKDSTEAQKRIKEVNPGYFCLKTDWLWTNLDKLKNHNAQGEYYLTDLVGIACSEGEEIATVEIEPKEALGVNTAEQLELIENLV